MALSVEVVSTDRTLWSGEASRAIVPAADGEMGILPGHSPVLAVLRRGAVRISPDAGDQVVFEIAGGFVSLDQDNLTVVIEDEEIPIDGFVTASPADETAAGSDETTADQAPTDH